MDKNLYQESFLIGFAVIYYWDDYKPARKLVFSKLVLVSQESF